MFVASVLHPGWGGRSVDQHVVDHVAHGHLPARVLHHPGPLQSRGLGVNMSLCFHRHASSLQGVQHWHEGAHALALTGGAGGRGCIVYKYIGSEI